MTTGPTKTVYFIGSDGRVWNGSSKYWGQTQLSGTVQLESGIQQASLFFDINLIPYNYLESGITDVYLTIGQKTYSLYKNDCFQAPNQVARIWNVPSDILEEMVSLGQADLTLDVCLVGGLPYSNDEIVITAYMQETFTQVSSIANLAVNVSAAGTVLPNVPISLLDTLTQESYSGVTDQNGNYVFTDLPAGDTVEATVSYGTFATSKQSVTLQAGNNSLAIVLTCATGYQFCGGSCIQSCPPGTTLNNSNCQCEVPLLQDVFGSLGSLAISIAIAAGVVLAGYAIVKIVPSRQIKENINETGSQPGWGQKLKSAASSAYQTAKAKSSQILSTWGNKGGS
ncbi:MAG: carboxypeptidase regulatory-like domain-containing protein [Nitrososphaerota archaeon]